MASISCRSRWVKSTRYTGGEFMFLYQFVCRRSPRHRPQTCSRDNFWTTFRISFIFGTIDDPELLITWLNVGRFSSWPWIFKVKYGISFISAKMARLPRNTNKYIHWTLGPKCDYRIWSWPWSWPLIWKAKYEICYISTKNGPIATKWKGNILNSRHPMQSLGLTLTMTLTLDFHDLDLSVTKMRCKDLHNSDRSDIRCRRVVDWSSWSNLVNQWRNNLSVNFTVVSYELESRRATSVSHVARQS